MASKQVLYFLPVLILAGCLEGDAATMSSPRKERPVGVTGIISEIRLTTSRVSESKGGDNGTGGAIVGHLLGGASGAVIGATMTASPGVISVSEVPVGCRLEVVLDDGSKIVFTARADEHEEKDYLIPCSLFRIGDEIDLTRHPPYHSTLHSYDWRVKGAHFSLPGKVSKKTINKTDST